MIQSTKKLPMIILKIKSRVVSVFTLFAVLSNMGFITSSQASDLWEVYQMALANDPTYKAAGFDHKSNLFDVRLAKSAFKPTISTTAQIGWDYSDVTGTTESGNDNIINLNLTLPVYDKMDRIEIKQSKYREEISVLQLQQSKQELMLRVANRYFNVLAAQDALVVAQLEKIAIKRQMDLANERLEVGLGTRSDLFEAQSRFKAAEAGEIQAQNQINNNIALLKQIIGTTPEALIPLSESAPLDLPSPNDVDHWITQSNKGNLQLNIQAYSKDIALDEIKKQKSLKSPVVTVEANHNLIDNSSNFNAASSTVNTTSVSAQLRIPLYLGGTTRLLTKQAGLQYNQTESQLEEARRAASTEATSAFLDVSSGVSQVEALFDAIRAGESALDAKDEGFKAGLTTNLDVLDAQRDLSQTRTDYLSARYSYILSVLELERAVGDLNDDDIKRVNGWLGE